MPVMINAVRIVMPVMVMVLWFDHFVLIGMPVTIRDYCYDYCGAMCFECNYGLLCADYCFVVNIIVCDYCYACADDCKTSGVFIVMHVNSKLMIISVMIVKRVLINMVTIINVIIVLPVRIICITVVMILVCACAGYGYEPSCGYVL